jgi:single-strand DNA-binding protein
MPTVVTIVGNLVKDPEEKNFGDNKNVTRVRVACSDRMPDGSGGWKDSDTAYYNVSAWRNLGKNVASTLKKGDKVIIQGKMKYSEYKKSDGSNAHSYEIEATDIGVVLTNKTSKSEKNPWATKDTVDVLQSTEEDPWK